MRTYAKDFEKLITCTCMEHHDREPEDIIFDANLSDPECPVHGVGAKIVGE